MQKRYTVSDTARILKVHRQTVIYWMEKGWVLPKRDYRNWPVFTEVDLKKIKKWRRTLK
jgi:DNA-binding transcriptional MerR regulator